MMSFVAVHESGYGPSRHLAALQQTIAFGGKQTSNNV